jgi:predicted phosphodiesterase
MGGKLQNEVSRIWGLHGDHVASIPLGRDGLASLLDHAGERRADRGTLDKVVRMARSEGGPNTPPTPSHLKASRGKTIAFLKTLPSGGTPDYGSEHTHLEEGEVGIEGIEVDRTLYLYDEAADEYKTFVTQAKAWITTSGEAHRAIIEWYSNWNGQPVSLNGISRRTGLPRTWVVGYLKAHGITHDSAPFSAEEVARRGVDELAQEALALKFGALATKTEELNAREVEKAARSWWDFEASVLGRIHQWVADNAPNYSVPKLRLTQADRPYALVVSATDLHWGMRSWPGESGYEYSRKECRRRLMASTQDLIGRLPGNPEEIVLAVGSDFFHIDGVTVPNATTRGTPQSVDGTPLEILLTGAELCREHVDVLAQVAPVKVVLMAGNHDRNNAHALLLYLHALYGESERVNVVKDHRPRVYEEIGTTLACFTHGDRDKVKDLGAIMAKERRTEWGRARHHVAFGGHLHHQRVQEINGVRHYLLPSLAPPDAWHAAEGYVTSEPGLMGVLIDLELGPVGTVFCPVRPEEP